MGWALRVLISSFFLWIELPCWDYVYLAHLHRGKLSWEKVYCDFGTLSRWLMFLMHFQTIGIIYWMNSINCAPERTIQTCRTRKAVHFRQISYSWKVWKMQSDCIFCLWQRTLWITFWRPQSISFNAFILLRQDVTTKPHLWELAYTAICAKMTVHLEQFLNMSNIRDEA